jgi:hypothetical protein
MVNPQSTMLRLLDKDSRALFAFHGEVPALNVGGGKTDEVHGVLRRIMQAIAEIGYDNFLEDVTSKEFAAGENSPLGSADVTVVPGPQPRRLSGIVVGITKGSKSHAKLGFPRVMEQIKTLLREGKDQVAFGLVLCDAWDTESFRDQHLEDLQRLSPVPFLFMLVGSPESVVTPVAIAGGQVSGIA